MVNQESPSSTGGRKPSLSVILETLSEVILLLDGKGIIRFAGGAVQKLIGYRPTQLVGQPATLLFVNEEDLNFIKDEEEAGRRITSTVSLRKEDGAIVAADLTSAISRRKELQVHPYVLSLREIGAELEVRNALAIRNRQLATFSRITGMVALGGEINTLLERLLLTTMQSFNLARGAIHMLNQRGNKLLLVAHRGVPSELLTDLTELHLPTEAVDTWIKKPRPTPITKVPHLPEGIKRKITRHKLTDATSIPLISKGQSFGILTYLPAEPLHQDEASLLEAVAGQLALAVEKNQLLRDLQESQNKYSSLVERANDGIMISQDMEFKFVNKRLADLIGYTVSDMIGMDITRVMLPEDREGILKSYEDRVSGRVPQEIYQGRLQARDGRAILVEFNATTIDYEGRPASLSMVRDMTVRKQLQDELIEERNTAEFYNDILTHDVNNLLHTTIGNLHLMSDDMSGNLNKIQEQQRQKALAGAKRCAALVDQVRELMMIRHLDPASFMPLRLTKLVPEAADVVREQFPDAPFTMNLNAQANQFILGHRLSANLFINLISNAIRHNSKEKKIINVSVTDTPDGKHWSIALEDNGDGIPDELKSRIYERFTRFSKKKGFGLGMSIVNALVKVMNGTIEVQDRVSKQTSQGTRFIVKLPKG